MKKSYVERDVVYNTFSELPSLKMEVVERVHEFITKQTSFESKGLPLEEAKNGMTFLTNLHNKKIKGDINGRTKKI